MTILNFVKNYGKVQVEAASEGFVNLAAKLDADGVSEAAIKQKQDEHNEVIKQLVEAQADWKRENAEYEAELSLYNKRMSAAERAQADLEKDPTNKDAELALGELLDAIEKGAPKLDKEKREADQAKSFLDQLQEASTEIAEELKNLRSLVTEQKQAIKEAEIQATRNQKLADKAEVLAGLRKSGNKFDVALNALKAQTEAKQKEAEELRIKAEQLTPKVTKTSAAADKYMTGADEAPQAESLQERLARLKK